MRLLPKERKHKRNFDLLLLRNEKWSEIVLDEQVAKEIISSLSGGTVAVKHVHYYDVGRQEQVETVKDEIENNTSKLRFINGDYSTGKTHFLSTIRHWAIQNDYIPSHVVLSPRGTPLHDLKTVYSRIMKNLVIDEQGLESPIEAVLEFIFQVFKDWVKIYIAGNRPRCEKYGMEPLYCQHCNVTGKIEELYIEDFKKLDVNLRVAIILYRSAKWGYNPDFVTADFVIRWLEGEPLYRRELNYLGLWEDIGKGDILRGLSEIAKLISLIKKKGMVIMLDEAEGIENLTLYQKPIAYENLQFLVNGVKEIENLYFLYATTPAFYNDVESYSNELAHIVNKTACTDLLPLTPNEIKKLASNVVKIYMTSIAQSENTIARESIMKNAFAYCDNYLIKRSPSVRDMITGLFNELWGKLGVSP